MSDDGKDSLQDLKKQGKQLQDKIKQREHEQLVKDMAPISGNDFLWYMIDFANDILFSCYEPREFESEGLPEIRKIALKYGLRPTDGDSIDVNLQKLIDAADEAKRRAKND